MTTTKTMRRLFSGAAGTLALTARRAATVLLLMVLTTASAWAWSGQGTEADPYKIASASDLAQIRTNVNAGTNYENVYFVQTADIDCSTLPVWNDTQGAGIGRDASHPFKGRYDGGGYKIKNLRITATDSQYAGLFGYIEGGAYGGIEANTHIAEVHGVVLDNPTITITATGSEKFAGAIVGYAGNCSQIYNNTVIGGTVTYTGGSNYNTDNSYVGGIVGSYVNSNFQRLVGNTVVGTSLSGAGVSGGLAGILDNHTRFSGNFADASISGADFRAAGVKREGALVGHYTHYSSSDPNLIVNYYHSASGLTAYGDNYTNYGSSYSMSPVADNAWAAPLYTVGGLPSGATVSGTPAASHDGKGYYAEGAVLTIGTGSADKVFSGFTATGATASSLATDRRSATVTVGTADVTVSATLQTVSGTTADGLTWSLAQDDSGNYTRLTVGGNGAMQNYSHTTDGTTTTWRTDAPWGYGLTSVTVGDGVTAIGSYAFIGSQSLAAATIGSSVATIGQQAFDHCDALVTVTLPASVTTLGQGAFYNCIGLQRIDILHDGAVSLAANVFQNDNALQYIVFPSPAALQANTTASNWSAHAAKLRAKFGNQHFAVTTEGGTPAYQIATADDLRHLTAAVNATAYISTGKTFRQTADIDLASGGNFTPIGSLGGDYSFAGTYDGGGHTISGLTVSKKYGDVGLFSVVKGATVRNVILLSPNVKATTTDNYSVNLGALIGTCGSGSSNRVENCHVVNPTVSSSSPNSRNYVGAIIGNIYNTNTTATNCYYYGGNATAACGHIENGAPVTRVCAAHLVTPADGVTIQTPMAADLGFTCDADNNGTAENYWRTGAQLTLVYTGTDADGYTIGYTATNGGTISGSTLTMPDADVTVTATLTVIPWDGDGSKGSPYLIKYASQLDLLAHRVNGTHGETLQTNGYYNTYFQLDNDITYDYTGLGDSDSNYEAIGDNNRSFRGHFDGNSKTISGIRIYKGGNGYADYYQGIFGRTDSGADIHDLTLADARITGFDYTGGIVGYNNGGTVTRCHVAADVAVCAVNSYVLYHGGIAGNNWGTIEQCTSAATLTLTDANNSRYYGGIAGYNENGTLRDNLAISATVPAAANNRYGTITGYNDGGTLQRNYYAACKVANTENATGVGCQNADVTDNDGAMPGYLMTLGEGVTSSALSITIPAHKELNSSGQLVTVAAVTYNVAAAGTTVWFNSGQPDGYSASYSVNGSPVSGNSITMPAAAVTVTVTSNGESIDLWGIADGANGNSDHPYTITTTEGWNLLAGNVAAGKSYSDKYFQLGADNISISTMVGTNACHFSGHFNGNGNTLAVSMTSAGEYTAPFRYVGGATITGLHTTGTVTTAHKYATGLVGRHNGNVTISNCRSSVAIVSSVSGDGTHGGFVATGSGTATIEGCLFDGVICTTASDPTNSCGGFVGWNGGTVNISNSLYAPASVPEGKHAIGTDGCATFARNGVNSIANSYYTQVFGTAQGKACHSVTAGDGVTIDAIALTGDATEYTVSGITAYSGGGLQRGENLYYGSGDQLSLTLANNAGDTPEGYQDNGYTASAGTISGSTLTMPAADVTVSVNTAVLRSTGVAVEVSYLDADGNTQTAQAIALDGSENSLAAGTYFVGLENVNFDHTITLTGNVTLILKDGCEMKVGTDDAPIVGARGIRYSSGSPSLTIYGQSLVAATAGHLYIYAGNDNSSDVGIAIGSNYTQHSGNVTIVSTDHGISANGDITLNGGSLSVSTSKTYTIRTYNGNVALNGGQFDARFTGSGSTAAVRAESGTITLGWTNYTDSYKASSYSGTVKVADGQMLTDGNAFYSGTLTNAQRIAIAGKTLQPVTAIDLADNADNNGLITAANGLTLDVTLKGRTLYKDGKWNTLCLPFALSAEQIAAHADLAGATLMELNTKGTNGFDTKDGTLYLTFKAATAIAAGVPYLVKWDAAGTDFTSPTFSGVTIDATASTTVSDADGELEEVQMVGCYSPVSVTANDKSILFLGDANTLYYSSVDRNIRSCRAYFSVPYIKGNPSATARAFRLDFGDGEQTGIMTVQGEGYTVNGADAWYTLDGRKLDGKPATKGLYINGGKKVVIK